MMREDLESATMDETYNGWKNYPTWCVNLWLSNDGGLYRETLDRVDGAKRLVEEANDSFLTDRIATADEIKSYVRDELAPDLGASFAADLLGYALDQVDWFEIADAWLED